VRILIIAEGDLGGALSGTERVVMGHATELIRRGHQVMVMAFGEDSPCTVGTIQGVPVRQYRMSFKAPWTTRRRLRRLPEGEMPDLLLAYQPFAAAGIPRSGSWREVPLCYVALATWEDEYAVRQGASRKPRPWVPIMMRLRGWIEEISLRRASRILVLSRFTQSCVQAAHPKVDGAFRVVPGGVDADRFRPVAERMAVRRVLGLPERNILLLTVRNLEPRMGLENLLRAYRLARAKHPDLTLAIGGKGPLDRTLRALAEELGVAPHVHFLGYIPDDVLPRYYQTADLFILPTTAHEGFGLVTVEALACGTPVLGTPVGATPEILGEVDAALLAYDASPEALAHGIDRWLARHDQDALRARCRAVAERRYSWVAVGQGLEQVFREAVGKTRGGGEWKER